MKQFTPQIARITRRTHCNIIKGKRVLNDRVEFQGLCSIFPGPRAPVFEAKTVYINNCNKKFADQWLYPVIFPKVETILLNSQCGPAVVQRFPDTKIYLFRREKYNEWAKDRGNVSILDDWLFERWFSFETEPLYIVSK
jgi:hypothetical protein